MFYQRCGAHQTFRIIANAMSKFELLPKFYAASKLFNQHRPRAQLRANIHAFIDSKLVMRRRARLPQNGKLLRKVIKEVLLGDASGNDLWGCDDDADSPLDSLLRFLNMDLVSGQLVHSCGGSNCCEDIAHCRQRCKDVVDAAIFNAGKPTFEPARFVRQQQFIAWLFLFFLHQMGKDRSGSKSDHSMCACLGRCSPGWTVLNMRHRL